MKVITEKFRCDLCGRWAKLGVREEQTEYVQQTQICHRCVNKAIGMIVDHVLVPQFGGKAGA